MRFPATSKCKRRLPGSGDAGSRHWLRMQTIRQPGRSTRANRLEEVVHVLFLSALSAQFLAFGRSRL